ncbi:MAG TPA: hypothetical protein VMV10_27695 [Pirellulales bacterium]|nr:hypothetical protein [Pirellulales bacterium]
MKTAESYCEALYTPQPPPNRLELKQVDVAQALGVQDFEIRMGRLDDQLGLKSGNQVLLALPQKTSPQRGSSQE